jgi:hypothetical protein
MPGQWKRLDNQHDFIAFKLLNKVAIRVFLWFTSLILISGLYVIAALRMRIGVM